jgi:hypothetical protein
MLLCRAPASATRIAAGVRRVALLPSSLFGSLFGSLLPSSLFGSLFGSLTNVGRRLPAVAEPRCYCGLTFGPTCEVNASALPSWSLGLAR